VIETVWAPPASRHGICGGKAVPDGYTLQYTVADSHLDQPARVPKIRYDAMKEFTPVAVVGECRTRSW
jgi:hypothetical protein